MRFSIIGISYNNAYRDSLRTFLNELIRSGDEIAIYDEFRGLISADIPELAHMKSFTGSYDIAPETDCFISIGGDGTFLHAVQFARDSGVPILGLNTGRLGYLTAAPISDAISAVGKIRTGDYLIEPRSLLRVDSKENVFGRMNFALNDFTIHKKDSASMITIHVHIDGVFLNSYWGDGLIISTPTGSTAYSLSCGGPIIAGECGVFAVTPIAPHNLNVRPVVISEESVITLTAETRNQHYLAVLDSRSESVDTPVEFTIRKERFSVNMVRFTGTGFAETIRGKLYWGLDRRN